MWYSLWHLRFKSSSLLLNIASNPTDCSRPTSNGTCAMEVGACKCQLAALLPQAPQHSPAGITTYSANYKTAQHPLSHTEWFQSLRGKGQALHGPLLSSDQTGCSSSTTSMGILPSASGTSFLPWKCQAVPQLIKSASCLGPQRGSSVTVPGNATWAIIGIFLCKWPTSRLVIYLLLGMGLSHPLTDDEWDLVVYYSRCLVMTFFLFKDRKRYCLQSFNLKPQDYLNFLFLFCLAFSLPL